MAPTRRFLAPVTLGGVLGYLPGLTLALIPTGDPGANIGAGLLGLVGWPVGIVAGAWAATRRGVRPGWIARIVVAVVVTLVVVVPEAVVVAILSGEAAVAAVLLVPASMLLVLALAGVMAGGEAGLHTSGTK